MKYPENVSLTLLASDPSKLMGKAATVHKTKINKYHEYLFLFWLFRLCGPRYIFISIMRNQRPKSWQEKCSHCVMQNNVRVNAVATSTFRPIQRQFVWTGPPFRYSSLALEYICIFLSWLIFFSSAGFSFLWFTSTIIVAKRAWRLLLLHLGGRTLRVDCGGPIGQHTATTCQRFVKCGIGKGLTRSSRRWGSCHVYDDS